MLEVAANELKSAAKDFYNMTGVKIVLYDNTRTHIYSYPENMCSFCEKIRMVPALAEECIKCDNLGFDICDQTKKPHIYRCHMNLLEAIAPICENGVIIGYMMLGQLLSKKDTEMVAEKTVETSKKHGLDCPSMLSHLKKIKTVNDNFINSAVSMMSMCACYLYYNRIIENKSDVLSFQIKNYIDTHIDRKITTQTLCKTFFISKTKLYHLSIKSFGMGISDYIRQVRLEKAKTLLVSDTEKSVSSIAFSVGFDDANYFSRIFKMHEKMSPKEYRNKNS